MLNKELLMAGSTDLEPVLSIYISPDTFMPRVTVMLSSGDPFNVENTGETTFKFSEIDLNARICVKYDDGTLLSTSNLTACPSRERISRAPSLMMDFFYIKDRTQSASISLV